MNSVCCWLKYTPSYIVCAVEFLFNLSWNMSPGSKLSLQMRFFVDILYGWLDSICKRSGKNVACCFKYISVPAPQICSLPFCVFLLYSKFFDHHNTFVVQFSPLRHLLIFVDWELNRYRQILHTHAAFDFIANARQAISHCYTKLISYFIKEIH